MHPGLHTVVEGVRRLLVPALCFVLMTLGFWVMAFVADRSDFSFFVAVWGGLFVCYALAVWAYPLRDPSRPASLLFRVQTGLYIVSALFFRLALWPALPNLSDDVWRFLWDGHLNAIGIHPFADTPRALMESGVLDGHPVFEVLFPQLNSPDYYTVYPPLMQILFTAAAKWGGSSLSMSVAALKLPLLLAEVANLFLLRRLAPASRAWVWYALNPLVVLEVMGAAHFEGLLTCGLLAGLLLLRHGRVAAGGAVWSMAIALKLTPLMWVPAVWRRLDSAQSRWFALALMLGVLLFFIPWFDAETLRHKGSSLALYFRQFAFNGSLYYLAIHIAKALGVKWAAPMVGPALGAAAFAVILALAFRVRQTGLYQTLLWSGIAFLAFSSTVHPWYLIPVLAFSLLTPWRFVCLWTALAGLSYSHYDGGGYREHYVLIALEYSIVLAYALYEAYRNPGGLLRAEQQ